MRDSYRPKYLGSKFILAEFGGKPCPCCGNAMIPGTERRPTKDHVIPKSRGGTLEGNNCRIVCKCCNHEKADR
jgi:5-methylcytosine-specific restriction endonuclease McrA